MKSNPKRIRKSKNNKIDRISDLPDSILSKILSNLPTKFAVGASSILSTRWKNVSPFGVPPVILDLEDSLLLNPTQDIDQSNNKNPSLTFVDFVDKLFNKTLFDDVPCVEKMILKCDKNYDDAKIVSWICAALRLSVRYLKLTFSLKGSSQAFFHSLNGCTTLGTLWLTLDSQLCISSDFTLPNLKDLTLLKMIFIDENGDASINEFIQGCPALEDLTLSGCDLRHLETLCIKSPRIKSLLLENSLIVTPLGTLVGLDIDVPNLEGLIYNDCLAASYQLYGQLNCLQAVHMDLGPSQEQLDEMDDGDDLWYCDEVAELVAACSSTVLLYVAACSIFALRYSSVPLPVFQNLSWLSLGSLGRHWDLLADFLLNAPCLAKLTLVEGFEKNEEGFVNFHKSLPVPPVCLDLHLKTIEMWEFKEDEDEIKLIEYFLKNGKVMEELALHCLPLDDESIFKRFQTMPRQSKSCRIAYEWKKITNV